MIAKNQGRTRTSLGNVSEKRSRSLVSVLPPRARASRLTELVRVGGCVTGW
jgi:hypothetical protein